MVLPQGLSGKNRSINKIMHSCLHPTSTKVFSWFPPSKLGNLKKKKEIPTAVLSEYIVEVKGK